MPEVEELSLMKSEAVLINIARGPIVDEVPFWAALQDQKIGAAGWCHSERILAPKMDTHGMWWQESLALQKTAVNWYPMFDAH